MRPSFFRLCGYADLSLSAFARKAQIFHIVPLPDTKEHLQAFNDLALQWVPPAAIADKPDSFWNVPPASSEARGAPQMDHAVGTTVEAATAADEAAHALDKLSLAWFAGDIDKNAPIGVGQPQHIACTHIRANLARGRVRGA